MIDLSVATLAVTASGAAVDGAWSTSDLALRLGPPVVVLLLGVMVFVWGRTLRAEVLAVTSRDGFDGPPGGYGAGSAEEGPGVEEGRARLRHATQRVLAGLLLMLLGSLGFLAVIMWRLVS